MNKLMKTFTGKKPEMANTTLTKIRRIPSHIGDTILSCDKIGEDGEIERTEIVMFVSKPVSEENVA